MIKVIGVNFERAGKIYWFGPGDLELADGQGVVVETANGLDYGTVSGVRFEASEEQIVQPLRKVLRASTPEDDKMLADNKAKEKEAFGIAQKKIEKHRLEMKLVEVEYAFDGARVIFYFTANGRVDFRELVRDLAAQFRTRIELRQIGVRDEAKMLGGHGPCGRPICCRQFLADFQPVSIRMAKEQNLSLNPTKISGLCGRLMCCLKYEQSAYEQAYKMMPRVGKEVNTPHGVGIVTEVSVMKERLTVKTRSAEGSIEVKYYPFEAASKDGEGGRFTLSHEMVEKEEEDFFFADNSAPVRKSCQGCAQGEKAACAHSPAPAPASAPAPAPRPDGGGQNRRANRPRPPRAQGAKGPQAEPKNQQPAAAKEGEAQGKARPRRRRGGRRRTGGGRGAGNTQGGGEGQ